MTDLKTILTSLSRPKILVRAARHGLADYNRDRDLQRIAGKVPQPGNHALVETLVEQEQQMEETRQSKSANYSISHHIEVLVALMAECRLLTRDIRA